MEEEENVQTEEQKKKDEAEVKGNWYTMEATEAETREARGQGRWYRLLDCMPTISNLWVGLGTSMAILITSTTSERPILLIIEAVPLLVLCPGPT